MLQILANVVEASQLPPEVSVQTLGVHNQRRWKVRVELNLAERRGGCNNTRARMKWLMFGVVWV